MATDYGYDSGLGFPGTVRRHRVPAGLRAPFEGRTWREFGYVLLSLPISIVLFTFAVTMLSVGAGLLVTFLGIPVLAAGLAACRGFRDCRAGAEARRSNCRLVSINLSNAEYKLRERKNNVSVDPSLARWREEAPLLSHRRRQLAQPARWPLHREDRLL